MFTIQTAVTIVTAGIADAMFGELRFLELSTRFYILQKFGPLLS